MKRQRPNHFQDEIIKRIITMTPHNDDAHQNSHHPLPTDAASISTPTVRHSSLDNLQGLAFGIIMIAFGSSMLKAASLITGQVAGLSLLISHTAGYSFGSIFVAVNIPLYLFAIRVRGWTFTLRSLVTVIAVAYMAGKAEQWFVYDQLNPMTAGIVGGLCIGCGMIALFRHGASCGGMGIIALYLQDRFGLRAGWSQLGFDLVLFSIAFAFLPPNAVALSIISALTMNLCIVFNHRHDWYIAS